MNINAILRACPVSGGGRGAPMGARNTFDPASPVLTLQRVQMVDGDYAPDGTYWGTGNAKTGFVWCAFNATSRVYVRATTRDAAADAVLDEYPDAEISEHLPEFDLYAFLQGYIECALWSSHGPSEEPHACENLDDLFSADDIAPVCLASMRETCEDFAKSNADDLSEYCARMGTGEDRAGHDFWLTRNGHGAGFWDRGLGALGDRLADAARVYGSVDLYPGDDGLIYGE